MVAYPELVPVGAVLAEWEVPCYAWGWDRASVPRDLRFGVEVHDPLAAWPGCARVPVSPVTPPDYNRYAWRVDQPEVLRDYVGSLRTRFAHGDAMMWWQRPDWWNIQEYH